MSIMNSLITQRWQFHVAKLPSLRLSPLRWALHSPFCVRRLPPSSALLIMRCSGWTSYPRHKSIVRTDTVRTMFLLSFRQPAAMAPSRFAPTRVADLRLAAPGQDCPQENGRGAHLRISVSGDCTAAELRGVYRQLLPPPSGRRSQGSVKSAPRHPRPSAGGNFSVPQRPRQQCGPPGSAAHCFFAPCICTSPSKCLPPFNKSWLIHVSPPLPRMNQRSILWKTQETGYLMISSTVCQIRSPASRIPSDSMDRSISARRSSSRRIPLAAWNSA